MRWDSLGSRRRVLMIGGGNKDYYAAVASIYPLIALALIAEARLSGGEEPLRRPSEAEPWQPSEWRAFYWRVVPVMFGLAIGVAGMFAALRVLVEGHSTQREFWVADTALALEAGALVALLCYHIWDMVTLEAPRRRVVVGSILIGLALVVVVSYGVRNP